MLVVGAHALRDDVVVTEACKVTTCTHSYLKRHRCLLGIRVELVPPHFSTARTTWMYTTTDSRTHRRAWLDHSTANWLAQCSAFELSQLCATNMLQYLQGIKTRP